MYENKTPHHVQPTHTVDSSQLLASMTCGSVEEDYGPKYSVLSMLELLTVLSSVTEHCRQKEVSNKLTMQTKKQRTNTTMQTRYTYLDYCVHGHGRLQSQTSPWIRAHSGISIVDKGLDIVRIVFWYLPTA